ncbi:MAG TPA: magnesium transporter CorA family protein [Sphingomicrobium sp.]|nr:magnesium transporter CorA family protein [Sphingomicrobium sp.]
MLRAYGPDCDGSIIHADGQIPAGATWIDLDEPTKDEEKLVEKNVGVEVPTPEELAEIEPSSRLYERNGALYMTLSTVVGITEGRPASTPIGFVLTKDKLVTVRYATPKPVMHFIEHALREPELVSNATTVTVRLLDAIIDRLADELEAVGARVDKLSGDIFPEEIDERRIPAHRLTALLARIGRAQALLARIRETAVSTSRLLGFLAGSSAMRGDSLDAARAHVGSLTNDVTSLIDYSSFLNDNLTFLLDASLGLISIEQNAAMKLFSWAAVVFLPPTLIAGIYGMNFDHMPELKWLFGYPMALSLILISAVAPFLYFKKRGWI